MAFVSSDTASPPRPERFAWSDEEAQIIFGGVESAKPTRRRTDVRNGGDGTARILVAGDRNAYTEDLGSALETARDALEDRFVVLERSGQFYMQCLCQDTGWLLEKREGSEGEHFRAVIRLGKSKSSVSDNPLMDRIIAKPSEPRHHLGFAQVLEAMRCYHQGEPVPHWIEWERIQL